MDENSHHFLRGTFKEEYHDDIGSRHLRAFLYSLKHMLPIAIKHMSQCFPFGRFYFLFYWGLKNMISTHSKYFCEKVALSYQILKINQFARFLQ
jgi:hypothetical protein